MPWSHGVNQDLQGLSLQGGCLLIAALLLQHAGLQPMLLGNALSKTVETQQDTPKLPVLISTLNVEVNQP